ncbi:MAG: galactan endo-1,6-beta-galactosidase [Kiritimatiellia bacterium]
MNIARYNAAASSWNSIGGDTMVESPNIIASRQMRGFWRDGLSTNPASGSWDWSVDSNQIAMLIKARDRGANHLELFSNSPMWWMCENLNTSGADDGAADNLNPAYYDEHAIYLATVAKYAQDNWGITFDSVSPFNEPDADWWRADGTQEGCHFDPATQETVISLLRDELDNQNLTSTIVAASDESLYDTARATWNSFSASTPGKDRPGERPWLPGYRGSAGLALPGCETAGSFGTPSMVTTTAAA